MRKNAWRNNNKEHSNEYHKNWNKQNPTKRREYDLKKYGLTLASYTALCIEQQYRCLICHKECELVPDHSHESGSLRGLPCRTCNSGIGLLKDSIDLLTNALEYLRRYDNT